MKKPPPGGGGRRKGGEQMRKRVWTLVQNLADEVACITSCIFYVLFKWMMDHETLVYVISSFVGAALGIYIYITIVLPKL